MYFNKIRHPANFTFPKPGPAGRLGAGRDAARVTVRDLGGNVFRVAAASRRWPENHRLAKLASRFDGPSGYAVTWTRDGGLAVRSPDGIERIAGRAGATFGQSGQAWMFRFGMGDDLRFYGQGEKNTGFEKSGKRTKYWNTDVWGDFNWSAIESGATDPMYVAVPYLLIKQGDHFLGILVDNPGTVFMDLGSNWFFSGKDDLGEPRSFWFGADDGEPAFYVIGGPDPHSVTRKLQQLVGTTPMPPLWALGHHQCKWGYTGIDDLTWLDRGFRKHKIPCDGLWLDIDYMDAFKVFTTNPKTWRNPAKDIAGLHAHNRRVIAILDPGVKVEPGYKVCDDGLKRGVFCENAEGQPYVGFVWPGRTYFPDFSQAGARDWWAGYVKDFGRLGFDGAWLDMNDPSVGAAELDDMRFKDGKLAHWTYHNQYALGMGMASRDGFLAARPDERPFLLSRSGCTGTSAVSAIWTGDNCSNWHHLRQSIPVTLNLALSGIPFNGPDVPGFGGDASPELAIAWYKAGFLFPVLRNHCIAGTKAKRPVKGATQEPWAFGDKVTPILAHYIRLRYKLLPYLYRLFAAQEEHGSAIMRPLFLDFAGEPALEKVEDQFLVGEAVMQAPVLVEKAMKRQVILPGKGRWYDAANGRWIAGGRTIAASTEARSTPLFFREGTVVPMQVGEITDQAKSRLDDLELHVFLPPGARGAAAGEVVADDGISFGYRDGQRTSCGIRAQVVGRRLQITIEDFRAGWRPLRIRVVAYGDFAGCDLITAAGSKALPLARHRWTCAGGPLACRITPAVTVG
jgi:alpha-glucosidase